jgi:hypothetical protein
MPDPGGQLITSDTLLTFAGLSTIVQAVTHGLKLAFGWQQKMLFFYVALVVCIGTAVIFDAPQSIPTIQGKIFLAILNAVMVAFASLGNNMAARAQ